MVQVYQQLFFRHFINAQGIFYNNLVNIKDIASQGREALGGLATQILALIGLLVEFACYKGAVQRTTKPI